MLRRIRDSIRVKRRNRKGGPASHRPGHGITAMTPGRAAAVAAGRDRRSKMLFRLHGGSALDVNKQLDVDAYERSAGASAGGPTEPAQKPMPEIDRRKMMLRISGGSALEVAKELDVDLDRDRSMPEETESRGETPRYAPQLKPLQPVMLRRPTSFKLRGRSSPPPARLGCKADARASEVEPQLSTAGHTQPWRKATNGGFANQNSRFMSAGGLNGKSDQSSRLFRPGTMSSLSASLAAVASSTVTSGDRGSTEPATPVRSAHKTVAELEHEAELDAMDAIADLDAELSAMSSPAYGFGTAASKPESPSYGFGPASITPVAARLGGFTAATCATDNGTVTPVRQAAQANRRASSAKQKTPKSKRHSLHAKPAGQFKAKQSPLHGRSPLGTIGNGRQNNRFNIGQKQLTQVGASAELATPLKPNPRAEAAAEWTNKEVRKLIEQIKTLGAPTVPGGQRAVRFGQLFAETENLFEALAGTCKTAKKYGVVEYDGEHLWQGQSDDVVITLLRDNFAGVKAQPRRSMKGRKPAETTGFGAASMKHAGAKCAACSKTATQMVYAMEYVGASGKAFHKQCFRCFTCNNQLKHNDYSVSMDGKFRCGPHHREHELGTSHL